MSSFETFSKRGTAFLGVKYPILCGAMTWISDAELVKSVSNAGGFGVLAGGNLPPDIFEAEVDKCIDTVKGSFGVNLITIAPNYKAHYEILKSKDVPIVVFAGSFPRKSDIQGMKQSGKKTLSFASEGSLASQQIKFGIDGLILEGSEAGGHIGHVSLIVLLQQVLFEFNEVPIFVGGGLAAGRMVAHLLLMGASGCQFGTRFAMSEECRAHENFKSAFVKARARQAISTPQYDSRLPVVAVRALKNRATEEFGHLQLKLLQEMDKDQISREKAQFEVERFWIGSLRDAVEDGDIDKGSLMAGQSVGLVHQVLPIRTIIQQIVEEADAEFAKISAKF